MSRSTPGPWEFDLDSGEITARDGAQAVASVMSPDDFPCRDEDGDEAFEAECIANGRMLAAAPELRDALKAARHQVAMLGGEIVEADGKIVSDAVQAAVLTVIDQALARTES